MAVQEEESEEKKPCLLKEEKKLFKKEKKVRTIKGDLTLVIVVFSTEFTKLAADIVRILILIKFYRRA